MNPSKERLLEALDDLETALARAETANWVMDQLKNGELCFLTMNPPGEPPCWISKLSISAHDLAGWLADLALRELTDALEGAQQARQMLEKVRKWRGSPERRT